MREFFKACNVYCRPESDEAIVASVYNHAGLTAEKPGGAVVLTLSDTTALDTAIQTALDLCQYEPEFNYSQQKQTDWPAFQISKYKTVRKFELEYLRFGIRGVNEKNLFYAIESPEFGAFGLLMTVTVNANQADFGRALQYLLDRFLAAKQV